MEGGEGDDEDEEEEDNGGGGGGGGMLEEDDDDVAGDQRNLFCYIDDSGNLCYLDTTLDDDVAAEGGSGVEGGGSGGDSGGGGGGGGGGVEGCSGEEGGVGDGKDSSTIMSREEKKGVAEEGINGGNGTKEVDSDGSLEGAMMPPPPATTSPSILSTSLPPPLSEDVNVKLALDPLATVQKMGSSSISTSNSSGGGGSTGAGCSSSGGGIGSSIGKVVGSTVMTTTTAAALPSTVLSIVQYFHDQIEPSPRINPCLMIKGHTLFLYGGVTEMGDVEMTLDDCWSLDINKRLAVLLSPLPSPLTIPVMHTHVPPTYPSFFSSCSLLLCSPLLFVLFL